LDGIDNYEIILSDNQSTDRTVEVAKAELEAGNFSNIKIYSNDQRGIGSNWNYAIGKSSGEYVKLLMQDDLLYPGHLSELKSHLDADRSLSAAFSSRDVLPTDFDVSPEWLSVYGDLHSAFQDDGGTNIRFQKDFLRSSNFLKSPRNKIGEPSFGLLRRKELEDIGLFNSSLRQALDYECWYRLLKTGDIILLRKCLGAFRIHSKQATQTNAKQISDEYVKLYLSYFKNFYLEMNNYNRVRLARLLAKAFVKFKFHSLKGTS
jgi:glycosyltransferase involved in cell wall biosynthesis